MEDCVLLRIASFSSFPYSMFHRAGDLPSLLVGMSAHPAREALTATHAFLTLPHYVSLERVTVTSKDDISLLIWCHGHGRGSEAPHLTHPGVPMPRPVPHPSRPGRKGPRGWVALLITSTRPGVVGPPAISPWEGSSLCCHNIAPSPPRFPRSK